jgi:hypothetical protein
MNKVNSNFYTKAATISKMKSDNFKALQKELKLKAL